MALCLREGFITGCPDGTAATKLVRAVGDTSPHPVCDSCALDLATVLGTDKGIAVLITAIR